MAVQALIGLLCLPLVGQTAERHAPELSIQRSEGPAGLLGADAWQAGGGHSSGSPAGSLRGGSRDKGGKVLGISLIATGLILTDKDSHGLIGTNDDGLDGDVSQIVQTFGLESGAASVAGLYVLGDDDGKETARLAGTAVLSAAATVVVLKHLTGRERPHESDGKVVFRGPFTGHVSFPSGHTAIASSLATVYGARYPKYELAFDLLAVGVGVSRMREDEHFLSDVFVAAVIGRYFGHRALEGKGGLFGWRF